MEITESSSITQVEGASQESATPFEVGTADTDPIDELYWQGALLPKHRKVLSAQESMGAHTPVLENVFSSVAEGWSDAALQKLGQSDLLTYARLNHVPDAAILAMVSKRQNLIALSLGGKLPVWDVSGLNELSGLRSLSINFYEAGPDLSGLKMPKLRALSLFGIRDDQIPAANQFPNLVYLAVGGSPISDTGTGLIADRFPELRYLHIALTKITPASLDHLERMKHLRELVIGETPLSATMYREDSANLARLRNSLPNCYINYGD